MLTYQVTQRGVLYIRKTTLMFHGFKTWSESMTQPSQLGKVSAVLDRYNNSILYGTHRADKYNI